MPDDQNVLTLLSGGLDSSSLLYWIKAQGWTPVPLFINYGQTGASPEMTSAQAVASRVGKLSPICLSTENIFSAIQKSEDGYREYFPSRNLYLLTIASMVAYKLEISRVMIGLIGGTAERFPDTSPEFLRAANRVLALEHPDISFEAPFISMRKEKIVDEAIGMGLPVQLTYSCNMGRLFHCWTCASCLDRWDVLSQVLSP